MNNCPKVSIIVPVYKVEKYLSQCIESIISQTYTDWELLLIDDGSPDNSGKICDEYALKDSRIRVFHKENAGVGAARNTGLENAKGVFIVFVDSDDFCEELYLSNFRIDSSSADLVIQGFKKYTTEKTSGKFFHHRFYTSEKLITAILDNDLLSFGAPYCKLFRQDIITQNNIRFSTKYSFGEDTYFFFDYLTHIDNLQMVDSTGYCYRCEQGDSLSMKNHEFKDLTTFANDSLTLIKKIDKNNKLEKAYSHSYVGLYARALANMYRLSYSRDMRIGCIRTIKMNKHKIKLFEGWGTYKYTYLLSMYFPSVLVDICLFFYNKLSH